MDWWLWSESLSLDWSGSKASWSCQGPINRSVLLWLVRTCCQDEKERMNAIVGHLWLLESCPSRLPTILFILWTPMFKQWYMSVEQNNKMKVVWETTMWFENYFLSLQFGHKNKSLHTHDLWFSVHPEAKDVPEASIARALYSFCCIHLPMLNVVKSRRLSIPSKHNFLL